MRNIFLLSISFLFLLQTNIVFSQENNHQEEKLDVILKNNTNLKDKKINSQIFARISSDNFVKIGDILSFSAEESTVLPDRNGIPRYIWNFGDGKNPKWGKKVSYKFDKIGVFSVKLKIRQSGEDVEINKNIIVYNRTGLLVSEEDFNPREIIKQAGSYGVWLKNIPFNKEKSGFLGEEEFIRNISEQSSFLYDSDFVIFQTSLASGLQNFAQWWVKIPKKDKSPINTKLLVHISENSFSKITPLIKPIFKILKTNYILLTRFSALDIIFANKNNNQIIQTINNRGIENKLVDDRTSASWLLPLSKITSYFVANGLQISVIYLLLVVPIITFIISFFRQFIGISTFGVFAPLMLALSFMVLGLQFGFMVFVLVLIVSYLIRTLFSKIEILYIPRVSLLFSALSLSFFLFMGLAVYFDVQTNLVLAVFPMMMMATVSEKFISEQGNNGTFSAIISAGETILVSLVAVLFIQWEIIEGWIMTLPELVFIPILLTIWLGKFTGLRISEYIKFRSIFKNSEEQE